MPKKWLALIALSERGRDSAPDQTPGDISGSSFSVVATQPTRGTLVVECPNPTLWGVGATLKYDAKTGKHLLSVKSKFMPDFKDLPLNYSDSDGFSGETAFSADGKEYKATATIQEKEGESKWLITVKQNNEKLGWSFSLGFGKKA